MNTVLLIDDDTELVAMFTEYLEQEGFTVACAHDRRERRARSPERAPRDRDPGRDDAGPERHRDTAPHPRRQ
jgi:hypothetical protein